jgi:outer membrane protein assembly factor BamB
MDRGGNVLFVLQAFDAGSFRGHALDANHAYIAKATFAGDVLWIRELPGFHGTVESIAVSADGTLALAGHFSGVSMWREDTVATSVAAGYLLTIDPDGRQRWIRKLAPDAPAWQVALDSAGNAALVGRSAGCTPSVVLYYDTSGDARWSRTLPWACGTGQGPFVATLENGDVLVGGMFTGTVDFDQGAITAMAEAAFFMTFAP